MLIINSVQKLNRFANGCSNKSQLLNKLIDQKQVITLNIARLVKPVH